MTLSEWCAVSREEEKTGEIDTALHSNFVYSRRSGLINALGLSKFENMLSGLSLSDVRDPVDECGKACVLASRCWQNALKLPSPFDIRLSGRCIPKEETPNFLCNFECRYYPSPSKVITKGEVEGVNEPVTGGASVGQGLPVARPALKTRIVWLTSPEHILGVAEQAFLVGGSKLSVSEFYSLLICTLGLSWLPGATQATCRLRLYKIRDGHENCLVRPHALSGGYPNKFCAKTKYEPFGTTIRNECGNHGLAEAICPESSLVLVDEGNSDYSSFISRLSCHVDTTSGFPTVLMSRDEIHGRDLRPKDLVAAIVRLIDPASSGTCAPPLSWGCLCGYNPSTGVSELK